MLEENFSRLSSMVPRYLYCSTGFPWVEVVDAAACSLCLLEKVTTIFLVSLAFNSRHELQGQEDCIVSILLQVTLRLGGSAVIGVEDE